MVISWSKNRRSAQRGFQTRLPNLGLKLDPMVSPASPDRVFPVHASSGRVYSPLAALLSFLVPGLGQLSQGRLSKGLFFLVSLYGLFFTGMYLGDWKNVYLPDTTRHHPPTS